MSKKTDKNKDKPILSPFIQSATELYFDAMELLEDDSLEGGIEALKCLEQAYSLEPLNVDVQIGFVHAYGVIGFRASAHAHIERAFELTKDMFPIWPEELPWGNIENRGYLRALHYKADLLIDQVKEEEAMELYELLLVLNPNDNQGIRYIVAGLYSGINGNELNAMIDEGNEKQDWTKVEKLLETQNSKHNFWTPPEQ